MGTVNLVHPRTSKQADNFLKKPSHALLILGQGGSGKLKLARSIAHRLLKLEDHDSLANYPFFIHVKKPPAKQEISIDEIRQIIRFLRLKTPGKYDIRRVILIDSAQFLSIEAQNAFLKMLEEPADDSVFLLTATSQLDVLPTIASRCQQIWAHPVTLEQARGHYQSSHAPKKIDSAWRLSQGQSLLLDAILKDIKDHPLKKAVEQAKDFIEKDGYERLLFLDAASKDHLELENFLEALAKVLTALHHSAVNKNNHKQAEKLRRDRQRVLEAVKRLDNNANTRLLTLDLILNLNV